MTCRVIDHIITLSETCLLMHIGSYQTAVEYMSVDRVERGGLFNGMSRASLLERARDSNLLSLQAGAAEFLKTHKGPWGIVSVGWSGIFIREALQSRGVDLTKHNVQIQANEVIFNQHGMGTGEISKHQSNAQGIRTARDKLREMRKMVDTWRSQESDSGGESRVVVSGYVVVIESAMLTLEAVHWR